MIIIEAIKGYSPEMRALLRRSRYATHLTYLTRFGISEEHVYSLLDNDIQSVIDSENSTCLIAADSNRVRGILIGSFLKWDTDHFGFPCYKINYVFSDSESNLKEDTSIKKAIFAAFKERIAQRNAKFATVRVVAGDWGSLWALEDEGFNIVDTLVVLAKGITKTSTTEVELLPFPTKISKGCQPGLFPKLKSILSGAFPASRFIVDFHFPAGSGEQLYLEWLETTYRKSVENNYRAIPVHSEEGHKGEEEKLLILEKLQDNEAVGFTTYKAHKTLNMGSIELIVSNPKYRGLKVGKYLIGLVESELRAQSINTLEVTAYLYNYPALNTYVHSSFSIVSSIYTFHSWL